MKLNSWLTLMALAAAATCAQAGVTAAEAERLKTDLTPFGGERAGNKDGSIPAWTGGYTQAIPGDKPGGRRGDPFKDEKPLFSINPGNMAQYEDRLTDGQKALLKKYPEYRIDVYKTHRTAAAPQWVYDNTFKNATRASLKNEVVQGAFGGIPFPIAKTAEEVMSNHSLRWRGTSFQVQGTHYVVTSENRSVLTSDFTADMQLPYYFQDSSPDNFYKQASFWQIRLINSGPPIRAGEAITGRVNVDGDKDQAWVYLTGQRRVRKLPNPCCDTPTPATSGVMSFDEIDVWAGRLDRYDWKLLGKKEMFIPYNGNKLMQPKSDNDILGHVYPNPDYMRWELHRVWVVEANLRAGARHQAPKGRYYCDEDTWICVLGDRWDARGQLWKTLWGHTFVAPDLPGTMNAGFGFVDLVSGSGFIGTLMNGKAAQQPLKPRYADEVFTPDAMAGEGVR